jgi:hypothetical protein
MHKNRPLTVLLSTLLILSLACSTIGQLFASQNSGKREVSSEPPTLPAPPKPASAPQDTPDEQAVYFADQLAAGENHLAVWMGVYDALGIPVIGQDGVPLGSTGDDPIGPRFWQVWYSSGLDLPGRGIPLQDVGRLFANGLPDMDGTAFGAMLLDDLRLAAQSNEPRVRLLGLFVRERILRGPSHVDILEAAVTPDTAVIDIPTVQLISWIIIRNALFQAASQASVPGAPITYVDYHPRPAAQDLGPQISCSDLPGAGSDAVAWHNWILNKVGGGLQLPGMTDEMALPSFVELVVGKVATGTAERIENITKLSGKLLGYANVITSAISLILQLQAMEVDATMEPPTLIRTHKTSDGEQGTIALRLYSDPKGRPDGDELESCLASYLLNALGVSFGFPKEENIPGAEIAIKGGKGIPELVLINETTMRFWTGANGQVTFHVIGKGQNKTIPDSAKPVDKEFSIHVSAQPEEAGLGSMANIFFDGLTGLAGGAGFLSGLIDVLKTFTYDMGEIVLPLTDWETQGYKVLDPGMPYHTVSGVVCDLGKPFTIQTYAPAGRQIPILFTPSSPETGSFSYDSTYQQRDGTYHWYGSGPYTINGGGTDKLTISVSRSHTCLEATYEHTYSNECNGAFDYPEFILVPLDTNECSQP